MTPARHPRACVRLLFTCGLLGLAATISARAGDTTDRSAEPSKLAGIWDVGYEDLALGEVDGTAEIDARAQHATVTLRHPTSGKSFKLVSESVTVNGDDCTIVLVGDNPAASSLMPDEEIQKQAFRATQQSLLEVLKPGLAAVSARTGRPAPEIKLPDMPPVPPTPKIPIQPLPFATPAPSHPLHQKKDVTIEVPDSAGKIQVRVADFEGEIEFRPRHAVETNRVTLHLHYYRANPAANYTVQSGERLAGSWTYYADPVTWRDGAGRGRVGNLRRDRENPNLVTQSAQEQWLRGTPTSQLQLFAVGVFHWRRIDRFYLGVPTVMEAIFDEPQPVDTCHIDVSLGDRKITLPAHRDPDNWRRFTTDPFLPGDDPRPAPPPTAPPAPKAADEDESQHPI